MTFHEHEVSSFLTMLEKRQADIRAFPGCLYLEIVQDVRYSNIIFSHSQWESEAALNAYRHSNFFKQTWAMTKPRFAAPAQAWTVRRLHELL
jgi:quinol monooxygenase YgiN